MKHEYLVAASLALGLTACGGGSDSGSLSGTVVGSYFGNAVVCADRNGNGRCDAGETSTRTDKAGAFRLPVEAGRFDLIAEIGTDAVRYEPADGSSETVRAPIVMRAHKASGSNVISALSTVVAQELDGGVAKPLALSNAMTRIGPDLQGIDSAKLLADYNLESDPLTRSLLHAAANNLIATIQEVLKNPVKDIRSDLALALARTAVDPNVLYVWSQFGAADSTPFSKISITGSTYSGKLNDNPVGKVADSTTYTINDASGGQPYASGVQIVRAVTKATSCPVILVDGVVRDMKVRAPAVTQIDTNAQYATGSKTAPIKADFGVTTCEYSLPAGARTARINGQAIKVLDPAAPVNRIVVIGDTGCRIKGPTAFNNGAGGDPLQDCTDDRAWPYRRIAAAAASLRPDLIVHNGDIHYREGVPVGVEVPTGVAGTASNESFIAAKGLNPTITYGWAAWEADFFKPSGPLLAAAPWAITRGNHESCFRAAAGWFRFLDPRPFPAAEPKYSPTYDPANCSDYIDPVAVVLKDLQLILLDNSGLQDDPGQGKNQGWTHGDHLRTARQLKALAALPASNDPAKVSWIVTHKPLFAYTGDAGKALPRTWQYQKAIGDSGVPGVETYLGGNATLPANTQMLHAGHIHGWQMISHPEASQLPTSFLIGVSGDTLEAGFMFDKLTGAPLAPANFGSNISSGVWPWLGANAVSWFGSLGVNRPDAFSTSPIVNAGDPAKAKITDFGFVVFDRIPGTSNWKSTFYNMDRQKVRSCTTIGKRTSCDG